MNGPLAATCWLSPRESTGVDFIIRKVFFASRDVRVLHRRNLSHRGERLAASRNVFHNMLIHMKKFFSLL